MRRVPPVVAYTVLRIALFAVPFGVLLLLRVPAAMALLIAFVLSAALSIFVLSRLRDAMSASLVERRDRAREAKAKRAAAEDAWDEAQRGGQGPAASS